MEIKKVIFSVILLKELLYVLMENAQKIQFILIYSEEKGYFFMNYKSYLDADKTCIPSILE